MSWATISFKYQSILDTKDLSHEGNEIFHYLFFVSPYNMARSLDPSSKVSFDQTRFGQDLLTYTAVCPGSSYPFYIVSYYNLKW